MKPTKTCLVKFELQFTTHKSEYSSGVFFFFFVFFVNVIMD